jgi:hypothetical protein
MKRTILAALMVFITLALTGCGDGGSSPPPTFVAQITSESSLDGDIFRDLLTPPAFTITQGMTLFPPVVQSVLAGIDSTPLTGGEYRAFLNFRLDGTTNGVPLNAIISSAFLDLFITSDISGLIPVSIDLVSLQSLTSILTPPDFNSGFLKTTRTILNLSANVQQQVLIDVTPLMVEAQRLGLPDFQIRILCETGIIEIDDTTSSIANRDLFAPLLEVTYF